MTNLHFKLDGHDVVPATFEEGKALLGNLQARRVASTVLQTPDGTPVAVSTVFLVVNASLSDPPLVFETLTMSTDDNFGGWQKRYATWDEAERGHQTTVALLTEHGARHAEVAS